MSRRTLAVIAAILFGSATGAQAGSTCVDHGDFTGPEPVTVHGYADHLMEPFLSRDGRVLLFNNNNSPADLTDIHWAEAEPGGGFRYRGLLRGAASSTLDGVPTLASDGTLCLVSARDYFQTLNTIFCGRWNEGAVEDLRPQSALSVGRLGRLNFDVEITADGRTLYYADGLYGVVPVPRTAVIRLGMRAGDDFRPDPRGGAVLASLNALGRVYAPAISADGCEIIVTRLTGVFPFSATLWRAVRPAPGLPFGRPRRQTALSGFVEGATFAPDGRTLYYHRRDFSRFRLYRATR